MAASVGVVVVWWLFPYPLLGVYRRGADYYPHIGLDQRLQSNEPLLRCVLAEELGHHFTSDLPVLVPYLAGRRPAVREADLQAVAWAARVLMPPGELVEVLVEVKGVEGLAERFGVTPSFADAALQLLPMSAALHL